jgi:hypothetical protein
MKSKFLVEARAWSDVRRHDPRGRRTRSDEIEIFAIHDEIETALAPVEG